MSDEDSSHIQILVPPPPDDSFWSQVRNFFRRQIAVIRLAEFGVALAFAIGAWFAGGEMFLVIPALVFAWGAAFIGLLASNLRSRYVALWAVIIAGGLVAEGSVLYWHFHEADARAIVARLIGKSQPPASSPAKPSSPPAAPTPSKTGKPAWVTPQEIDDQQKFGKTLLIYSPEELLAMSLGSQNMSIFYGKWIKLDYPSLDIPQPDKLDKENLYVIKMSVDSGRIGRNGLILAYFYPAKWGTRLLSFRAGDQVKAICQLRSLQRGPLINIWNFPFDELIAENCDLL